MTERRKYRIVREVFHDGVEGYSLREIYSDGHCGLPLQFVGRSVAELSEIASAFCQACAKPIHPAKRNLNWTEVRIGESDER